ncbi:MAG: shikimate dehydrogenase [Candidatus Westeberhardia cardiocondylae]|nr:shikimate dehydrogenase [Candidatus Westeberhardia cardiocondylae]
MKVEKFNVFGNPIKHSLSPEIYFLFSLDTGVCYSYGRVLVLLHEFEEKLKYFFSSGGLGANITLPFKERAFSLCDVCTDRALLSKTVNTIKKMEDGSLLGDNTDGVGLIYDLKRLCMINKGSRVLLFGAGGASRGIIPSLLDYDCKIFLSNRTLSRAKDLKKFYQNLGEIEVVSFTSLEDIHDINLIVNATSVGVSDEMFVFPQSIIHSNIFCYDLFYKSGNYDTSFISYCRKKGVVKFADGIGMLVSQAAYSFNLWHNIFPSVLPVIEKLKFNYL